MLGAIAGDIIGSIYEFDDKKPDMDFELFKEESYATDDTIMSVAIADHILYNKNIVDVVKEYGRKYPNAGYGSRFSNWILGTNSFPYNSYGNGSAMRVSPVGWSYSTLEETIKKAKDTAEISHNHPEGIKGAQSVAGSIFLARTGHTKSEIRKWNESTFGYNLDLDLVQLRQYYSFDETCQGTVPQALFTFLESNSFEESLRLAMYIGGDSDTLTCINGAIAEAYYRDIPKHIYDEVIKRLDSNLRDVVIQFRLKYVLPNL